MEYLELDQVLHIHEFVIQNYGGSSGLRDLGLLESALAAPKQTMFGEDLYPDIAAKSAMVFYSLVKNHPFVDANKRTSFLCLMRFLEMNGYSLNVSDDELYQFTIDTATSVLNKDQVTEWIRAHLRKLE